MSRPELKTDRDLIPGLAAIALFVVLAAVFLTGSLPDPATGASGFGEDADIMKSLGAALFSIAAADLVGEAAAVPAEGFLASFLIVAVALDAALDGSLLLAEREESDVSPAATDGGQPVTDDEGGEH